ncbi:MAG: hypothetical protein DYG98_13165 [Haliscomenobacteraceae bacterium CHB4]|nr:hypothetical protein [Saprospiraceae bacterium]MCE7924001.1 hypothetical protein [Haliscomenobacteraceae bacterium CHB4]
MNLLEVFESLHSLDLNQTLRAVNQSVYAPDLAKQENGMIISTGFTFEIHTSKKMELLYALERKQLIRQLRFDTDLRPCVAGLSCLYNGYEYINYYHTEFLLNAAKEDGSEFSIVGTTIESIANLQFQHTSFQLYHTENNEPLILKEFPLIRHLEKVLFFKNNWFYENRPSSSYNDEESYSNDSWDDAEDEIRSWDRDYPGWDWGRGGG